MSGSYRLAHGPGIGTRIERGRTVGFSFEGAAVEGFAGDTIASALAANGIRTLSRSFKYRRPRGILTMAGQDANTLVQLPGEPNVPADTRTIAEAMAVMGQNYEGSLADDRGARIEHFSRFLPVGFYYKAFFRPKAAWAFWEPIIRARAGLGAVDIDAAPGRFDKQYGFFDVVVVGAGPAGLAAAAAAGGAGARTLLVDDQPEIGGALGYARMDAGGTASAAARAVLAEAVAATPHLTVMIDATCKGWFADHWLSIVQGNRLHKVRARRVVLATGAQEQPAVFRNNDLPGVMLASAAQRLIRHYGVAPGRRAVVVTGSHDGYAAALDLFEAGIEVAAIIDLRHDPTASAEAAAAAAHGIAAMTGHTVSEARRRRGGRDVGAVIASPVIAQGKFGNRGARIDCDLVCMAAGYTPAAQLACHGGARLVYDRDSAGLAVEGAPEGMALAGSVAGIHALRAVIADGRRAGWAAARALGFDAGEEPPPPAPERSRNHPWPIFAHRKGKEFVDFDEDLQIRDITDAAAEGYDDIELLKRYSTVGMGPSQGRHSALATVRLAADATGRDPREVGTTTVRPPVSGEKLGVLAGRSFEPVRHTPMHHRHLEAGAQMMPAGAWLRPAYYAAAAARETAIAGEARHVREALGLIDVSTLGGLEIRGPDAAEFLNRMYTFAYLRQEVGRLRYVLMCDRIGSIVDDGVACRLAPEHFYVTATTGGVDGVYREMLWYNAQWRLDVDIANVTAAWCGVNIAGPRSRETLAALAEGFDLSADAFPYLGVRTGRVAGIGARLLRVGFVGELGYEIHVPASCGEALWDALIAAGAEHGIRPFGVEAQRLLRLEKGHIIVGQDTDGLTTPEEAGMAWAVSRRKPFFVGARAVEIRGRAPPTRRLAGFVLVEPEAEPPEECCLIIRDGEIAGRVTSAMRSPTVDRVIGLAFLPPEDAGPGARFEIRRPDGSMAAAEVTRLPFYDPDNARQEG